MGWRKKWRNLRKGYLSGEGSACGNTNFISSPDRTTNSAWAFGLTQTQSTPDGTSTVPLVSIAISNLRLCNSSMSASSSWRSGSPPVHTTKRNSSDCCGHVASIASANRSALENLPPPCPSTPTKSVSQNWQIALDRSFCRPDQRLHPENRQNTAARPAWAPSPCKV